MAAPTLSSATIALNGTTLTTVWDTTIIGLGGASKTPTIAVAGRVITLSSIYKSGVPGTTIVWTLSSPAFAGETVTISAVAGAVNNALDNDAISGAAVTNQSWSFRKRAGRTSRVGRVARA
jgi:hypothetical protein